jgi:hypothetical protein
MLKRTGPALALAALVLIAGYGAWLSGHKTPNNQTSSHRSEGDGHQVTQQTAEERIALYTEVLAWFTGVLAVVSAIQGFFLYRADNTARISANAAKAAAESAEKQMLLSGRHADITEKQHGVARLQFIAGHRPRLRLRNIVIIPPANSDRLLFTGSTLFGRCYVQNIGGMTATVIASHLMLYSNELGLPMASPYEDQPANNIINGIFNIGESRPFEFDQASPLAAVEARALAGNHPFFVMGWIHYRDDSEQGIVNNVVYRLAFCRRWHAGERRFVRIKDDPDYEYED